MVITETVYLGTDNTNDLLLKAEGQAVDLSAVTRIVLQLTSSLSVDSDNCLTGTFDWDTGTQGKLTLKLGPDVIKKNGDYESIPADTYRAILIVYDPGNENGIYWGKFNLVVRSV